MYSAVSLSYVTNDTLVHDKNHNIYVAIKVTLLKIKRLPPTYK